MNTVPHIHTPSPIDMVVMGASLGGFDAVRAVLAGLGPAFDLPVALVLHRRECNGNSRLPHLIEKKTGRTVREPEDKTPVQGRTIYVAPMGYHLLVENDHFTLSVDEPVHYARPAIDILFDSAAFSRGPRLAGILMTGSGQDGIWGLEQIRAHGGVTLVQDPATAEAPELPAAALDRMRPDHVLEPQGIAGFLTGLCPAPAQPANETSKGGKDD